MTKQHIYCSVNNCHYWGQGNQCNAENIMVTSNTLSQSILPRWMPRWRHKSPKPR